LCGGSLGEPDELPLNFMDSDATRKPGNDQAVRASRCTSTATTNAICSPARGQGKRREFFYWTDDGNLAGLRYDQYKAVFLEQPAHGLDVWMQPFVLLRAPKLFNLRSDPFERAEQESGDYVRWFVEHIFVLVPAQAIVAQHIQSFQEFPPRQKRGSFSVDQAMQMLMNRKGGN
jgi:hypothetical protein